MRLLIHLVIFSLEGGFMVRRINCMNTSLQGPHMLGTLTRASRVITYSILQYYQKSCTERNNQYYQNGQLRVFPQKNLTFTVCSILAFRGKHVDVAGVVCEIEQLLPALTVTTLSSWRFCRAEETSETSTLLYKYLYMSQLNGQLPKLSQPGLPRHIESSCWDHQTSVGATRRTPRVESNIDDDARWAHGDSDILTWNTPQGSELPNKHW